MTFIKKYSFHGFILVVFLLVYAVLTKSNTGFFSDDYVWLSRYEKLGVNGLWNNYNDQFFLPLTYLVQITEWIVFKENYPFYFFVNALVFIASMFVFYELLKQLQAELQLPLFWSEVIVSIVLLSPYNTEVLKWYSSQSYLFATFFILTSFYFYFNYKNSNKKVYLYLLSGSFFISILFKEIGLFFPISIFLIEVLAFRKKINVQLLLVLCLLLVVYFSIRALFLGNLVGGYGSEIHLDFSLKKILTVIAAYFAKFFFLYRYEFGLCFMLLLNLLFLAILLIKKNKQILFYIATFTSLFLVSLLPVINLEISFLDGIQSDRYGYLPGIFAAIVIGTTITFLFDKKSVFLFCFSFGIVQFYFLHITLNDWTKAQEFKNNFIQSVRETSAINPSFILVNLPDNYNGVYIFRNGFESFKNKDLPSKKIAVGVLHQSNYNDQVQAKIKNSHVLISTKSGKFFPYIRSSFKPSSIKSNQVIFDLKNWIQPIYMFNGNNLDKVDL